MTTILKKLKSNCALHKLVREIGDDGGPEVRWLSHGRVMGRVWKLQEELVCFKGQKDHIAHLIQIFFWLAGLAYLVDIFIFGLPNNITL